MTIRSVDDDGVGGDDVEKDQYSSERDSGLLTPVKHKELKTNHSDTSSDINLAALNDPKQRQFVEQSKILRKLQRLAERLSRYQIEGIGITPLPLEQRKGTQWWSPGFIWFSANVNGQWQYSMEN